MSIIKQNKNKLSKEMKELRKKYAGFSVNKVVKEIEKYYKKHKYSEKELINRIQKLEEGSSILNNIFATNIGLILGLTIGPIEHVMDRINDSLLELNSHSGTTILIGYIIVIVYFLLSIIVIGAIVSSIILLYNKLNSFAFINEGRNKYLNEKEIEVIKSIIDNPCNKKIKNRKYKHCRRRNKTRTYLK